MLDYQKTNYKYWNRVYSAENVESCIFRLKPKLLDFYINPKKKLTVLDYGCGEGSNINFLTKKYGYNGYGVDISKPSIEKCKKKLIKINKNKFKVIPFKVNENDIFFNKKFDLIISVQTLYYLSDIDLKNRLKSFNKMLKKNGYVFFTMMSKNHYLIKEHSNQKKNKSGLINVDVSMDKQYKKRQKQNIYNSYINVVNNKNDLLKKFKLFKPLSIGYYDISLLNNKSTYHYTFFGKKF